MKISVEVRCCSKHTEGRVKAFAAVRLEDSIEPCASLIIRNIRIFGDEDGPSVVFPTMKSGNRNSAILYWGNAAFKKRICDAILTAYLEKTASMDATA